MDKGWRCHNVDKSWLFQRRELRLSGNLLRRVCGGKPRPLYKFYIGWSIWVARWYTARGVYHTLFLKELTERIIMRGRLKSEIATMKQSKSSFLRIDAPSRLDSCLKPFLNKAKTLPPHSDRYSRARQRKAKRWSIFSCITDRVLGVVNSRVRMFGITRFHPSAQSGKIKIVKRIQCCWVKFVVTVCIKNERCLKLPH